MSRTIKAIGIGLFAIAAFLFFLYVGIVALINLIELTPLPLGSTLFWIAEGAIVLWLCWLIGDRVLKQRERAAKEAERLASYTDAGVNWAQRADDK